MSLLEYFCNSLRFIHHFIPLTFQCNHKSLKLQINSSYCITRTKIFRYLIYSILSFSLVFCSGRFYWLIREWYSGSTHLLVPALILLSSVCVTAFIGITITILNSNSESIPYLVNQSFFAASLLDPRSKCNAITAIILHLKPCFLVILPLSFFTLLLNVELVENFYGISYGLCIGLHDKLCRNDAGIGHSDGCGNQYTRTF